MPTRSMSGFLRSGERLVRVSFVVAVATNRAAYAPSRQNPRSKRQNPLSYRLMAYAIRRYAYNGERARSQLVHSSHAQ
jgi:hypothetical protein